MFVMSLASQKGGSGKTTLAGHIAVEAERRGAGPVAVIDADPQGSLAGWWNARAAETPLFARTSPLELGRDIREMRASGIKLLIIDTPPAITATISRVIELSDLVIIPARPSPHDLRALGRTVQLAEDLDIPVVFVVSCAFARARITSEAAIALSQHGTVAPAIIHQRSDFASSMIDGRTVMEISRKSRSAAEIALLWEYLGNRLNKNYRHTILPQMHPPALAKAG